MDESRPPFDIMLFPSQDRTGYYNLLKFNYHVFFIFHLSHNGTTTRCFTCIMSCRETVPVPANDSFRLKALEGWAEPFSPGAVHSWVLSGRSRPTRGPREPTHCRHSRRAKLVNPRSLGIRILVHTTISANMEEPFHCDPPPPTRASITPVTCITWGTSIRSYSYRLEHGNS
ncbi:hypothetical protein EDC04DRAFT_1351097 [Pisolithus marmoratus]|nr:hypothetical protein EDC04DRAFT_1351097 [Pisolithus marmoratus]